MFEFLNRFPPPIRIAVMAGVPALLIIITLLVGMAIGGGGKKQTVEELVNKNDVILFRRMTQQAAGEAGAKLDEEKIPFKLVEDGTAISVPKDHSDKARIALAAANLPKDGDPGFSLFDKSDFISTDFDKKVKLLRAINGEIRRLIKQVDGVEDAAAMVTMPEDSLFQSEKKPVTAAVMVKMQAKRTISPSQVDGLTHLIASSVPGLTTDNVTITDDQGNLLTQGMEANAGNKEDRMISRVLNMQMALQRQKELEIEQKLSSLLDKVVGAGKSVVRVSLELDFNKRLVRNVLKAPVTNNGEPVSVNKSEQTETVKGEGDGGTPGVNSNVPTYPAIPAGSGGGQEVTRKNLKEQPAFNEETQLVQPSSGNIKRMSIAVLVPEDIVKPESAERIRVIIATAAGADAARRDQVSVERVKFDDDATRRLKEELDNNNKVNQTKVNNGKRVSWALVWWIGGGLLLLFLLLLLLRRATRREENPLDTLTASLGEGDNLSGFDQQALGGFEQGFPGLEMGQFGQPGMDQFAQQGQQGYEQQYAQPQEGYQQQGYAEQAAPPQPGGGAFDFLYEVAPDAVASAFEGEKPATIAGVLASVDPSYAEQVLQYLDPSIQEDVFNRVNQGANLPSMTARMAVQNLKRKLGAGAAR